MNLIILSVLLVVILLTVINFLICISTRKKLNAINTNCSLGDLDKTLAAYYQKIEEINVSLLSRQQKIERIEQMFEQCNQKIGCVRFDAFEDMGSELSFCVAILNGKNDGFVLTSLFGRSSTNMYVKPITAAKSNIPLSTEEKEAIENALNSYNNSVDEYKALKKEKPDRAYMRTQAAYDKAVIRSYAQSGANRPSRQNPYEQQNDNSQGKNMSAEKRESIERYLFKDKK